MKTSEILSETPYLHDGDYTPRDYKKNTFISDRSLARDFKFLGSDVFVNDKIYFHIIDNLRVHGTTKQKKDKTNEDSNKIIFSLKFKTTKTINNIPDDLKNKNIVQVDSVYVDSEYSGIGIASYVYLMLADQGYVILSDSSQFEDGKQLWKKIARESNFDDYQIRILDVDEGYLKDKDGKIISYDSSNVDDAKIWTSGANTNGEFILLSLKK